MTQPSDPAPPDLCPKNATPEMRVLFNGACPVCSAEIGHYKRYAARHDLPLGFEDLNSTDLDQWGLGADTAARQLYVHDGTQIVAGLAAFRALWARMPRYRWLARMLGLPVVRPVAQGVYDRALAPVLYHRHKRRMAHGKRW